MADIGSVPIVLDRERRLLFNDSALLKLRDKCKISLHTLLAQPQSLENLRKLIYCGLAHDEPLNFKAVKKLVTPSRAPDLWIAVAKALVLGRGQTYNMNMEASRG